MDIFKKASSFSINSFLFILCCFLVFTSCETEDDGYFTPPEIFVDDTPVDTNFTIEDPCLSSGCAGYSMILDGGTNDLTMEFFSSFDILRQDAVWGKIKGAVIVVHGNNRNANEYFNWMATAMLNQNLQNEVVFIAPHFKTNDDINGNTNLIYWSSNGWKRGFSSNNITTETYSSYDIVDTLIARLGDPAHFPFMENIVVTGHSSGAQFTGLYAASSPAEETLDGINMHYLIANNQYFFYPGLERWDSGANQFQIPTGCTSYTNWPFGTDSPTNYMSRFTDQEIRNNYTNRKLTYLLGTLDIFTNGTLNTSDCGAVLLGENRFDRGEKMFLYMETFYNGQHNHQKVVVNNVGHEAAQMYQSSAAGHVFRNIFVE